DNVQNIICRVVNENRSVPGADCLRYLGQNSRRCFLESDRSAEYLTDRVQKIDFFVTLGEVECCVLYLLCTAQNLRHHWQKHSQMIFTWRRIPFARSDAHPCSANS